MSELPAAVEDLRDNQGQADMDGVMVTVSRQALEESLDYITSLRAKVQELEAALQDAIDGYEEYAPYAGEYLCKKHGVDEEIARLRAVLTPPEDSSDDVSGR